MHGHDNWAWTHISSLTRVSRFVNWGPDSEGMDRGEPHRTRPDLGTGHTPGGEHDRALGCEVSGGSPGTRQEGRKVVRREGAGAVGRGDVSAKVIRDGMVAVIVSPGFGAGWSTWADDAESAVFA